jgi:uncharacterized protein (TIGR00725 family)
MPRPIVGVMGPGDEATPAQEESARLLGRLLAQDGWVVLTGGRDAGVMRAVNDGAKTVAGSLTVGVLPRAADRAAPGVDIVIVTEMQNARNNINVLSSLVVIAYAGGAGTVSEVALALKSKRPVVLVGADELSRAFFQRLGKGLVTVAETPEEAVVAARRYRPASGPSCPPPAVE